MVIAKEEAHAEYYNTLDTAEGNKIIYMNEDASIL